MLLYRMNVSSNKGLTILMPCGTKTLFLSVEKRMWMPRSGNDLCGYMEPLPGTDLHCSEVSDKNVALKKS